MSASYRIRTKDTDGLEFDLVFSAAEFNAVDRMRDAPGQIIELTKYRGFAFNVLGQVALCLKPHTDRCWHFFEYEQFRQGASLVV